MNNFKRTAESLPKTGHVNEVCKEWLVREDSALAYKLQSQEITDFYKGNRQRNAVVREDFPTALNEQIKEHENAEKQTEVYRRRLQEQEEHDKRVAKEIADKLERDLQEQRQRELLESEEMAQQMHELYVNMPPPVREKSRQPPPPRPAKASILQQNSTDPSTSNGSRHNNRHQTSTHHHHHHQSSLPTTQQYQTSQQKQQQQQQPQQHPQSLALSLQQQHFNNTDCYVGLSVHKPTTATAMSGASASASASTSSPTPSISSSSAQAQRLDSPPTRSKTGAAARQKAQSKSQSQSPPEAQAQTQAQATSTTSHLLKLSPEKYDQLVGNDMLQAAGPAAERHMQAHADDIELYVDPCDYASLKEIGLPMEEIKEMSKKLKQEQKDELLARRLQEMETSDGLTLEQRDRLLAIEAQDKELAKMLQERERAKAKRAKEKARLRKSQQKDTNSNNTLCGNGNSLHCGPLLPLPQDCLSFGKHSTHAALHSNQPSALAATASSVHTLHEDIIDVEAYSNPIDVLQQSQQRQPNGTLTNGSLTRDSTQLVGQLDNQRDDDIYTLPVDSCRPGQRPVSLNINGADNAHLLQHNNSMTRSEYSMDAHDTLNSRLNYSKSGTFDQSSSPTPPYMPIQGTRRSNSSEDRKKKSKDKCTHQ